MRLFFGIIFCLGVSAYWSQEVVTVSLSSCDRNSDPEYLQNRVIAKRIDHDTLQLQVGLVLDCCFDPKVKLWQNGDSLLFSIKHIGETQCFCYCCYELTVFATGVKDTNFQLFKVSEEWIGPHFDDSKAIKTRLDYQNNKYGLPLPSELSPVEPFNQSNEMGEKIGYWIQLKDNNRYIIFYQNSSNGGTKLKWMATYNLNEELQYVQVYVDDKRSRIVDAKQYQNLIEGMN